MTKSIDTLVEDIEHMLSSVAEGRTLEIPPEAAEAFGAEIADAVSKAFTGRGTKTRPPKTLYMSEVGSPCPRKVWYSVYEPGSQDPLNGQALVKFMYGDFIEAALILFAKMAGHDVTHEQESCEIEYRGWTIRGKLDCFIDGALVDVKSASSFGMKKFAQGLDDTNDAFGYRLQISAYAEATDTPVDQLYFLVFNKETGHVVLSEATYLPVHDSLDPLIDALEDVSKPPPRAFGPIPEGRFNEKLGTECSYCAFKNTCWSDANGGAGLRKFIYSRGPVWLTKVGATPNVPEVPARG